MVMKRGEIFLCDFGNPKGSEPGWYRPVLIVQDDMFNNSGLATTIVLAFTSNLKYQHLPGCLLLRKEETGLDKDSIVNATQLSIVNKIQLIRQIGNVPDELMINVEDCLKLVLGML